LIASVTNQSDAAALDANGYNYIGEYATANDGFTFLYKGQISGVFKFIDAYVNQIFMNSQFQVSLVRLLTNMNSIPYNDQGNAIIAAACQAPINQMLNFGGIVTGVALSGAQAAQVNAQAGKTIDKTLATRGWYLLIATSTEQQRAARQSPPMSFFYMDGGSVQQINMPSIIVQ
jgi:nitrate reductase alpha subunit